jgi:hypothetical protein
MYHRGQFPGAVVLFTLALYLNIFGYTVEQAQIKIAQVKQDLMNRSAYLNVKFFIAYGVLASRDKGATRSKCRRVALFDDNHTQLKQAFMFGRISPSCWDKDPPG